MSSGLRVWGFVMSVFVVTFASSTQARDLGKHGQVFAIKEEGFTAMIQRKLETIDMEEHKAKMQQIAKDKVLNPTPVYGIEKATEDRSFYYDPTYVVEEDIKLPCGKILHKAGASVNPLEIMDLNRKLFFIDGRDEEQVAWLKEQLGNPLREQKQVIEDRVILVGGSVFKMQEKLGEDHAGKVYFDQKGELTTRFGIKASPAKAEQEGLQIRIDEIKL